MTHSVADQHRSRAIDLARGWVTAGDTDAVALSFRGRGASVDSVVVGAPDDAIFVVASITKPIVGMAVLHLVERGELALGERVERFIPEFGGNGRHAVTVRHLLTHTSGLPDMLPDNRALREQNVGLDAFVAGSCAAELAFAPGHGVSYQSTGFALLGEIVRRVDGRSGAAYLREELFEPLGMHDSELGATDAWYEGDTPRADRIVELRVPLEQRDGVGWNWNSRYWRQLGAPWGGLLTTPSDLAKFAGMMLRRGTTEDGRSLFAPATIAAATRNQLGEFPNVPESDRRARPWGLGWRMNWPTHAAGFGDLVGPNTYGHFGATGTLMWIDPDAESFGVILTTTPFDARKLPLARLANVMTAAASVG